MAEKAIEITDIIDKEILDLIGILGTLSDEELEELVLCKQVGVA
tara:strand:+ start:380 stop:511 length:132 start_codon:yes stop_codon:yes gene_type:complete